MKVSAQTFGFTAFFMGDSVVLFDSDLAAQSDLSPVLR